MVVLGACLPSPRISPPTGVTPVRAPTTVNASLARTWDAVVDVLAEQNLRVRILDRSSGWAATQVLGVPAAQPRTLDGRWADCGSQTTHIHRHAAVTRPLFPEQVEYDIAVHGDSTHATVHGATRWGATYVGTWQAPTLVECVSTGRWEAAFEAHVKHRAESPR